MLMLQQLGIGVLIFPVFTHCHNDRPTCSKHFAATKDAIILALQHSEVSDDHELLLLETGGTNWLDSLQEANTEFVFQMIQSIGGDELAAHVANFVRDYPPNVQFDEEWLPDF